MANISQIKVGNTTYNIDAVTLGGKTYQEIVDLVNTAQFVVCDSAANTPKGVTHGSIVGTLEASSADKNNIYLVPHTHYTGDSYDEYVVINKGTGYVWEKIGNTDIDLSGYAKDGTYTTTSSGAGDTGNAGAQTVTTTAAGGATGTGTLSSSYDKATGIGKENDHSHTIDTHSHTNTTVVSEVSGSTTSLGYISALNTNTGSNHGSAAANTGNATPTGSFTGSEGSITVAKRDVTLTPTTDDAVTGVTIGEAGGATVSINSHTHTSTTVINSVTGSTGTIKAAPTLTGNAGGHTHSVTVTVTPTSEAKQVGSVSGTVLDLGSLEFLTGVSASGTAQTAGGHTHGITGVDTTVVTSVSSGTINVASAGTAATLSGTIGAHTHSVELSKAKYMTGVTGSVPTYTLKYTPAGTVAVGAHSHSYEAPADHVHTMGGTAKTQTIVTGVSKSTVSVAGTPSAVTLTSSNAGGHSHSISYTTISLTGSVSVAIADHTHNVSIGNHTHTIGNHTHDVTIQ